MKERLVTTAKAKTVALLGTLEASTEVLRNYPKTRREEIDGEKVNRDGELWGGSDQVGMDMEDVIVDTK